MDGGNADKMNMKRQRRANEMVTHRESAHTCRSTENMSFL